jgi:hypothetical protein
MRPVRVGGIGIGFLVIEESCAVMFESGREEKTSVSMRMAGGADLLNDGVM